MQSNTNILPQAVERPALRSGALFGDLIFAGCKDHPHRTDLSCCKIRRADGTPLSMADTWEEIQRLRRMCTKDWQPAAENPATMADIESSIKAHTQPDGDVIDLALCEATRLVLKPYHLYRFTVHEGCAACHDAALLDTDGRSPPF